MEPGVHEKCAVGAISSVENAEVARQLYETLFALQHRGAEASGLVSQADGKRVEAHVGLGLVRDVFDEPTVSRLIGNTAIGHNRYSTSGSKNSHLQPLTDSAIGLAYAHNGNLPDTHRLEARLAQHHIQAERFNDSEMMALAIAQNIRGGHDLPFAVEAAYPLFEGAFSSVAMQNGLIAAFRDPKGIRPLALGRVDDGYVVSSETCGLDIINAHYVREIAPGELLIIDGESLESKQLAEADPKLDMFEFVYFARHDSYLYGQSVNEVRRRFGEQLAIEHPPQEDDTSNIVVVPVPDTSIPAAEGYAQALGLKSNQVLIKNRYVGRTFMQTSQAKRQESSRRKHNLIPEPIQGRDVILIDDSIVRFNTVPNLVKLFTESGAKSVRILVASPPVRFPDFYGIDTPSQSELVAANMTIEQMRQEAACAYLGYLSLSGTVLATGLPASEFNLSCFTGEYPINIGKRAKEITTPVSMEFAE